LALKEDRQEEEFIGKNWHSNLADLTKQREIVSARHIQLKIGRVRTIDFLERLGGGRLDERIGVGERLHQGKDRVRSVRPDAADGVGGCIPNQWFPILERLQERWQRLSCLRAHLS
jgi:hypothetical protein